MAQHHRIVIAGAGIGGLTAALALARQGFQVSVLEAAPALETVGAGLQISPNASRILRDLGLGAALAPHVVTASALRVMQASSGQELLSAPLAAIAGRCEAPFWLLHRGDLQRVLAEAAIAEPGIDLHLGARVEDFAARDGRVTVVGRTATAMIQVDCEALIGADGLWSQMRPRLGITATPQFRGRTAWRALLTSANLNDWYRAPETTLWLGPRAHVVHYPVQGGAAINIVAIIREAWNGPEWSEPGDPAVLQGVLAGWAPAIRDLVALPQRWSRWALHELAPLPEWGTGPVTLLGDAAHGMPPFLAQGAAMAIEDAAVLAHSLAVRPDDMATGLRVYESLRRPRTRRAQEESARQAWRYGLPQPLAAVRDQVLMRIGGEKLLARYDWLYAWEDR